MKCPKCGSEVVNVQREQTGNIGGARTYGKKHHGLLYWLCIGWWFWIFKLLLLPITIWFGKRGKVNTIMAQKTFNKTVAVCQNCGNCWNVK